MSWARSIPQGLHRNLFVSGIIMFVIHQSAQAGLLENLSRGTYYLAGRRCERPDLNRARSSLHQAARCHTSASADLALETDVYRQISESITSDLEEDFFAALATERANQLRCASESVAQLERGTQPQMDRIAERIEAIREVRQQISRLMAARAADPVMIPLDSCRNASLSADQPPPPSEMAIPWNRCLEIRRANLALETLKASVPFGDVEPIRSYIETYSSRTTGHAPTRLGTEIASKYGELRTSTLDPEVRDFTARARADGGLNLTRTEKRRLLEDPANVERVLVNGGNDPDLRALACRADAAYGTGADHLDLGLTLGSLSLASVGTGVRAATTALRIVRGANASRATRILTNTSTRIIQTSAIAAGSTSTYSEVERSCLTRTPVVRPEAGSSCEDIASVTRTEEDSCILAVALTTIGYVPALPSRAYGAALRRITGSRLPTRSLGLIGLRGVEDLAPGSFVSVIWNPKTSVMHAVPSVGTRYRDGRTFEQPVPRNGGHKEIATNRAGLSADDISEFRGGGFEVLPDGSLRVTTTSRGLNGPSGSMDSDLTETFAQEIADRTGRRTSLLVPSDLGLTPKTFTPNP